MYKYVLAQFISGWARKLKVWIIEDTVVLNLKIACVMVGGGGVYIPP